MIGNMIIALSLCTLIGVLYFFVYTEYKDRQWRKNNPDEFKWADKTAKREPWIWRD